MKDGNIDLLQLSVIELLRLNASSVEELKRRGIVRTKNSPIGDYTEWLVSYALGLTLANNSSAGYDAVDLKGTRYQIKGRRVTPTNPSRQLSQIRNLGDKQFDVLAVVIFDADYGILEAVCIPHGVVSEYATYRHHVNAHILHLRAHVLSDKRVWRIPELFTIDNGCE